MHRIASITIAASEQIMVVGYDVRVEISCGKDPRICEHVAQHNTWFQTVGSGPEGF
jgi:hypothetical protein